MEKKVIEVEIKSNSESLKKQLREAQREVEQLAEKFGATSEQAIKAAKKAAELKDAIGDAKALTDAYNPDAKFNALTESLGGVLNGFQAFEGAMGLVGVSSEKVEEALLKVNSAMALAQGLNGVLAARESFANLAAMIGKTAVGQKVLTGLTWLYTGAQKALNFVMKQNPVMLIVAGVIALTGAIYGVIKAIKFFSDTTEDATKVHEKLNKSIERQDKLNEKLNGRMERNHSQQMAMLEARGGTEKQLHDLKMKQIEAEIKANEAQTDGELKRISNLYKVYKQAIAEDNQEKAKDIREQIKDREEMYNDLKIQHQDYTNEKAVLDAKYLTENEKKIAEEKKQASDKYKEKRNEDLKNLKDYYSDAKKVIESSLRDERENEIAAVDEKYKERFELAKKYGKDTTDLTIAYRTELNAIETKYDQERRLAQEQLDKEELDARMKKYEDRLALEKEQSAALLEARAREIELDPNALNEEKQAIELEQLKESYKAKFELATENSILEKQLEETYQAEKDAIKQKYSDLEKERIEAERQARIKARQEDLQNAETAVNAIQSLSDGVFAIKSRNLKKGSKEEEQAARKQFQINKALNLASAVVNGAQSILAITSTAVDPTGITTAIRIATQAALTAGTIAKIASAKFEGGGSSGGGSSAPSGGGGGGATPSFNVVGNSTANQLAQIEQKPVQAYVVSNEVTTQQALDRNRQVNATFG